MSVSLTYTGIHDPFLLELQEILVVMMQFTGESLL